MNIFELAATIKLDTKDYEKGINDAEKKTSGFAGKLKSGIGAAAKAVGAATVAASSAAAAGVVAITKQAVDAYANYEQLVGGVETLFKSSGDNVQKYASEAYKTAGLSANEYMETVTSFSASLLQSLGGDTNKAAEAANKAVVDMADNANKMGTSMESIQNAYQGFAKQNYTMLDNLKLGYGGTKEEMQRLLKDAEKLSGQKFDLSSYADIVDAIHIVQTEMGITGTTAKEAATTIQGSLASMKSSWQNLLTGLGDKGADLSPLINNLVDSAKTFGSNVIPVVEQALDGIVSVVEELVPKMVDELPPLLEKTVPKIINGVVGLVNSLILAIPKIIPVLTSASVQLVSGLANGIVESLPNLIPAIVEMITQIVDTLTNPETLTQLLTAAIAIIEAIAWGIIDNLPDLIDAAVSLINNLVNFILDPNNIANLVTMAIQIVLAIGTALVGATPQLVGAAGELIVGLVDSFIHYDWGSVGKNIVDGVWDGLKKAWSGLKKWFTDAWDDLVGGIKNLLGIHSPSRVFAGIGKNMALGLGEGWEDEFDKVADDIDGGLDFASNADITAMPLLADAAGGAAFGGNTDNSIVMNIYGAVGQDVNELATIIEQKIATRMNRRTAVYG